MSKVVRPRPLTGKAFKCFGDVIEASASYFEINKGYAKRYHDLAKVDIGEQGGRVLMSILRSTPLPASIKLRVMERHPLSSQAFVPLNGHPYIVAVAPKGDFEPQAMEVFLAQGTQGVNYYRGTWHHFCLALVEGSDFLVVDRGGEADNCDEVFLSENQQITVDVQRDENE